MQSCYTVRAYTVSFGVPSRSWNSLQEGRQNEKKRNKGDAAVDWIGQAVDQMDDSGNFDGTGRASVCFRDYGSGRICIAGAVTGSCGNRAGSCFCRCEHFCSAARFVAVWGAVLQPLHCF